MHLPTTRRHRYRNTKFIADRPYSDPEKAARKIVEIASSVEAG